MRTTIPVPTQLPVPVSPGAMYTGRSSSILYQVALLHPHAIASETLQSVTTLTLQMGFRRGLRSDFKVLGALGFKVIEGPLIVEFFSQTGIFSQNSIVRASIEEQGTL